MARWNFEPILESYATVAGLAGLLLLLVLLVRPAVRNLLSSRQLILSVLRIAVIVLLLFAMLRPARVSTQTRPQSATILLLYDESRSMQVEDTSRGLSRWTSQLSTLRSSGAALQKLADDFEIQVYSFSNQLRPSQFSEGNFVFATAPEGRETDIGDALSEVLRREAGKRLAAVVLLSDGAQRVYNPKVDVQQAARDLARLDCPLYTIAFGKPRDQAQARDVAIENMRDQYVVFVKNELTLRGSLRVKGFVNRPVPVRISVTAPSGNEEILGPIPVTAPQDDALVPVEFRYTPQEAGEYKMIVEADPQPGELVTDNNSISAYVTALDGGLRVLYLEGNLLGPEQQMLRRAMASSPDIRLDYRAIDPRLSDNWPVNLTADLEQNRYDIYLIGDVDARALGQDFLAHVARDVEGGKGLMMTGGLNTLGPGGYFGTPLADVLPVEFGRFVRQEFGATIPVREDLHLPGPFRMQPTQPHFITHLGQGDSNRERWQRLRPLSGANRVEAVKPRAMILARSDTSTADPLLVAWQYGTGRVLVFVADSTHLWARHGQQQAHSRFWRQAILWLGNKDELARRDVWVRLQRRRYRPGERIEITAGARSENGDPIAGLELVADLISPGGSRQPVKLAEQGGEWIGTGDDSLEPGEYQIEVRAKSRAEEIGQAAVQFLVQDLDLELSDPAADPDRLRRLSSTTKDSGGRVVLPEQLPGLFQELLERPPKMEIDVESKWRFGDTVWDTWPFFVVFVTVLGTEWWLRKKWGLA